MRHHMCDGIVTGYERAVITTGQSYNIVPQWEKKHLITKFLKFFDETTEPFDRCYIPARVCISDDQ
jgi:hypothetical protein